MQQKTHQGLDEFCGQPDCVKGVETMEKEYGSCYGGTLRPAWDWKFSAGQPDLPGEVGGLDW